MLNYVLPIAILSDIGIGALIIKDNRKILGSLTILLGIITFGIFSFIVADILAGKRVLKNLFKKQKKDSSVYGRPIYASNSSYYNSSSKMKGDAKRNLNKI